MANVSCLICCGKENSTTSCVSDDGVGDDHIISKQLNVIFVLKSILQIPTTQLENYLVKYGNPDGWINLCDKCFQLVGEARSLQLQILKISSELRTIRNRIVESTKRPVNVSPTTKLKANQKMTVWRETRIFAQERNNNYQMKTAVDDTQNFHQQQCPKCLTQIQIQLPPQLQQVAEEEASQLHKCIYCTSQFPSISSVLRHIQTVHEMQRLPCLHPGCNATLKNMKNFWEHRQRHKRKDEAASSLKTNKKLESEEVSSEDDLGVSESEYSNNHFDNDQDYLLQNQSRQEKEDIAKLPSEETPTVMEEECQNEDSGDDIQDDPQGNDNDWLPSAEEEEAEEEDAEIDVKPDLTPNATEDTSAKYDSVIKGGTRTIQSCPRCPLKFTSISSTLRHLSTTHQVKKLPCLHPGCTSALSSIKAYFCHRKLHLYPPKPKAKKGPRGPYKKNEKKTKGPFLCDSCGKPFSKKDYLKRHEQVVHLKGWPSTGIKVTCQLCGLQFNKGYLKKHILFMHKDQAEGTHFQCKVVGCKLFFIRQEGLDNHILKKHGGKTGGGGIDDGGEGVGDPAVKSFSCSYCGKGFCFKIKLDQHELRHKNNQLGIKPFVCQICGKGFGVPQNLANHLNITHKLGKKFQSKMNENS